MKFIHTAQLAVGKIIPKNGDVLFLDTTARSGQTDLEKALAPTWELVQGYKAGTIDQVEYTEKYLQQLKDLPAQVKRDLKSVIEQSDATSIVLACYDAKGLFCHRHLLQRYLVDNYSCDFGWEITYGDVTSDGGKPAGTIISICNVSELSQDDIIKSLNPLIHTDEIVVVDRDYIYEVCKKNGKCVDTDSDCSMERAMLNWILMSELLKLNSANSSKTYVDVTGWVDELFDVTDSGFVPVSDTGRELLAHVGKRVSWIPAKARDTKHVIELIKAFGFVHKVTLTRSYENVDHSAAMDVLYEEGVKKLCTA